MKKLSSLFERLSKLVRKKFNIRRSSNRKVAYTFIIGSYDNLKTPLVISEGWDYICFTDNPKLKSDVWDVRLTPRKGDDLRLEDKKFAMKHMILSHQYLAGYDLSLSVGGQIQINCDLNEFIRDYFNEDDDMMIPIHPDRDCIYDEGEACKKYRKDDPARLDAQMKRYREEGYPPHNGLYETGIIGMKHDRPNLKAMCELWWGEVKRESQRDQMSLNYAIWKSPPIKISGLNRDQLYLIDCKFLVHLHIGE